LIEFSDYECPFCRTTDVSLDSLRRSGKVRISYHHLPLSIHPAADGAARAAICAEEQGHFAQVHHELMSTSYWQRDSNWVRVARTAGIRDTLQFSRCLVDSTTTKRIAKDIAIATRLGVNGTPAFFTREKNRQGALSVAVALEMLA